MDKAMNKMFEAVGLKQWDKEFTKQDGWYTQKTWTKDQSNDFKKWFVQEIKKDLRLKNRQAEKEWQWFDMMWGWKESK